MERILSETKCSRCQLLTQWTSTSRIITKYSHKESTKTILGLLNWRMCRQRRLWEADPWSNGLDGCRTSWASNTCSSYTNLLLKSPIETHRNCRCLKCCLRLKINKALKKITTGLFTNPEKQLPTSWKINPMLRVTQCNLLRRKTYLTSAAAITTTSTVIWW